MLQSALRLTFPSELNRKFGLWAHAMLDFSVSGLSDQDHHFISKRGGVFDTSVQKYVFGLYDPSTEPGNDMTSLPCWISYPSVTQLSDLGWLVSIEKLQRPQEELCVGSPITLTTKFLGRGGRAVRCDHCEPETYHIDTCNTDVNPVDETYRYVNDKELLSYMIENGMLTFNPYRVFQSVLSSYYLDEIDHYVVSNFFTYLNEFASRWGGPLDMCEVD